MNQFEYNHQILTKGQQGGDSDAESRRLAGAPAPPPAGAGGQEAKGTEYKDTVQSVAATGNDIIRGLMDGVDSSWAILKPFLETVVSTVTAGNIYEVARKSYDLVRQMRKCADWYASTTRTTTLAELRILSTIP